MPLGTDGASASPVDQANPWDSVIAEGRAFGDALPLDTAADLDGGTPQGTGDGSSDGTGNGSPVAPDPAPAGDDGVAPTRDRPTQDPGASTAPADATATPPAVDPLAGAEPFTYAVGDETRTMDGVYRLPGDGLYVPEDKVPQFQLIASRAETLDRQNRDLYEKNQTMERLSSWQRVTGQDASGKAITETLTGQRGLEAQRVAMATFAVKAQAFDALLAAPNDMAGLLTEVRDAEGKLTGFAVHPEGLKHFQTQLENTTIKATTRARENFAKMGMAPPPPEPSVAERAIPSINALITAHGIKDLNADDVKYLVSQFDRYVTTANGQPAIDPRFLDVMKDRASLRAEQKRLATTSQSTDRFNGGMGKGLQRPAPARTAAPPAPIPTGRNAPKARTEPSPNDMWAALVEDARTASV